MRRFYHLYEYTQAQQEVQSQGAITNPFFMERHENREHTIDIASSGDVSSLTSSYDTRPFNGEEEAPSTTTRTPVIQPSISSSIGANSRNSLLLRRGDVPGRRRRRSPLNSGVWISFELFLTICQIVSSVVVLALSKNEHPRAPLFAWVVGYASGCSATLPILYWRYHHRNEIEDQDVPHRQSHFRRDFPVEPIVSLRVSGLSEGEDNQSSVIAHRSGQALSTRIRRLVEYFKMGLDCFFAVWFVVGNVWIFGGHSSSSDAPNLYSLCIVFLTLSCIGYAMPFLLCATICCCLPCLFSLIGVRDDFTQTRGATSESINALPTYRFKVRKCRARGDREINPGASDGGIVAAETEKEHVFSGEDAVCCICLARYAHNEELRELTCAHFFHRDCVDRWLKISASCPLCKKDVGEGNLSLRPDTDGALTGPQHQQRHEIRVGNSLVSSLYSF